MIAVGEAAAVTVALAALLVAFLTWLRSEPRPAAQHAAPRTMIVDVAADTAAANAPPPGYNGGDTDQWLATAQSRLTYDFADLAPGALDAAAMPSWHTADTMPPWPAPAETPEERDAWVQASLTADQPLEEPALAPLPQLGRRAPLARQHVWEPRAVPSVRHCAPQPAPAGAASDRDFVRSVIGDTDPAGDRATELPLVAYAQLGGRTVDEYVDELFAGMVTHG